MSENKSRHTVWLSDAAWTEVEDHYRADKKKQSSVLEAELFRIMEKSLKAAMDKAMDDIFRDWK